ncbi:hypothetical protein AAC387_Pa02g1114 [Persea americana]
MPEARDRIPGGGTRGMTLDFGLRPGFDIAALAQPRSGHERALHRFPLSDNKENIPPGSSTSRGRRRTRLRKSPLPSWYPRTPLRDITAIVNVFLLCSPFLSPLYSFIYVGCFDWKISWAF